jgi:hypothetical protein
MARDDWFRNHAWSSAIADAFFARLSRSKDAGKRAQYLRIQAVELMSSHKESLVKVALQLLEQHLQEFTDPYERTQAHAQAAGCYAFLNDPEQAFRHFRASLEVNKQAPHIDCGVAVEFPWLIATLRRSDLYDEALALLPEEAGPFPVTRFKVAATRAVIADSRGSDREAVTNAHEALEAASATESSLRHHQALGLVGTSYQDMVQWLRKRVAA